MAWTRAQVATTIKNFRYAVRSGACETARYHLKTLAASGMFPPYTRDPYGHDATWRRMVNALSRCKVAPHFRKRRRRR
jgi:hypothetical protein